MTGRGPCSAMRLSICERNYASPAAWSYFFLRSSMGMEAIRLGTVGAVQTKLALKNIKSMNVPFAPACAIERTTSTLNGILELI